MEELKQHGGGSEHAMPHCCRSFANFNPGLPQNESLFAYFISGFPWEGQCGMLVFVRN